MTTPTARRVTPGAVLVLPARATTADRERWLEARRYREGVGYCIGSSDVPAILGVEYTRPARRVWREKRGELPDHDSEPMYWGRRLEPVIAEDWARRNKSVIRNVGLVASVATPWAQATLDRVVTQCPLDRSVKTRCALEVKVRNAFGSHRWHADAPDDVLGQGAWQLRVTGFDHLHYAVLIGGNDYRQGVIRWDDALDAYVFDTVAAWRERYLVGEVEPPFEPDKATYHAELDELMHPERMGEVDLDGIGDVMDYAAVAARRNYYVKAAKRARALLLERAHGARYIKFGDELAYELAPSSRSHVDLDRLAEEFPDAYAACVDHGKSWSVRLAKAYKHPAITDEDPEESDD
jgi:putative phage-type endonuclease